MIQFDKPMVVGGITVPADVCQAAADAIVTRAREPELTFLAAKSIAVRSGVPISVGERFTDRVLQRLRKAGLIKFRGGMWRAV